MLTPFRKKGAGGSRTLWEVGCRGSPGLAGPLCLDGLLRTGAAEHLRTFAFCCRNVLLVHTVCSLQGETVQALPVVASSGPWVPEVRPSSTTTFRLDRETPPDVRGCGQLERGLLQAGVNDRQVSHAADKECCHSTFTGDLNLTYTDGPRLVERTLSVHTSIVRERLLLLCNNPQEVLRESLTLLPKSFQFRINFLA